MPGQMFGGITRALPIAAYTTAGFVGTRVVSAFVIPMLGAWGQNSLIRLAGKAGVAAVVAMIGGMVFKGARTPLLIGGLVEVLNEGVKEFVAPYVPMLAAYDVRQLSNYPDIAAVNLGTYPRLSNYGDEDTMM